MSECVVRMEMPGSCLECPFFNKVGCTVSGMMFPDWMNVAVRPNGCPILSVLPEKHGDLIDRETAAEGLSEKYNSCVMTCGAVMQFIDGLPTIVPATEGGKE